MARRRTRKTTRRSSPKKTNVLNLAQSVILGNAVTTTLFNTNMWEFVSGRVGGNTQAISSGSIYTQGQITLPELVGFGMNRGMQGEQGGPQGSTGYGGEMSGKLGLQQFKTTFKLNAVQGLTTLIVTPIAFKVISKLAAKPRREFNKLAKTVGLPISM
jgi:MFS family permease